MGIDGVVMAVAWIIFIVIVALAVREDMNG